jgi:superfamily II DNA/RNA helicase
MSSNYKNLENILKKLNINKLNPMQQEAIDCIDSNSDIILLSPTGTGKTLAFLLPIIKKLDIHCSEIQVLILVPSRELAIQIEQVIREMGSGFKALAIYGGRAGTKDKIDLKHRPAILVGTPGRIADRIRRDSFPLNHIKTLVLDEFDKSLEIGFEAEMREISSALTEIQSRILTSATQYVKIPKFVGLKNPITINYLNEKISLLKIKTILSPSRNKLDTLKKALLHIGNQPGIIFCNFKDTLQEVSDFLSENNISYGCFYGGMEQKDRERALIKFRNKTHQLLIATDLAARGIDVPEIKFIIHYELPMHNKEFTHRNGRTARMNTEGTAYILRSKDESLPDYMDKEEFEELEVVAPTIASTWQTLFISGGRKDKISKGDIAGLFLKQANLTTEQLGVIELKQDCAFVGVQVADLDQLINRVNNTKLKKKKVRVSLI